MRFSEKSFYTLGLILLTLGSIAPIANSIRIYSLQISFDSNHMISNYFAKIGPWHLFLSGCTALFNIFFYLRNRIYYAWWLHLLGIIWIGGGDSISAYIFLLKTGLPIFPICLPIIVTSINLIGLFLTNPYLHKIEKKKISISFKTDN